MFWWPYQASKWGSLKSCSTNSCPLEAPDDLLAVGCVTSLSRVCLKMGIKRKLKLKPSLLLTATTSEFETVFHFYPCVNSLFVFIFFNSITSQGQISQTMFHLYICWSSLSCFGRVKWLGTHSLAFRNHILRRPRPGHCQS